MSEPTENKVQVKEPTEDKFPNVIIEGKVVGAYFGKTKFDETNKNRIGVESSSIPYDKIHAFDSNGDKLTPKWFKDKTGYINVKSIYDIPVKTTSGKVITCEEWFETGLCMGATIRLKLRQKDGGVYPVALVILVNGEEINPFDEM